MKLVICMYKVLNQKLKLIKRFHQYNIFDYLRWYKIVFVGALANKDTIPKSFVEAVDEPDLFFVPVGGKTTIDATTAQN